MRGSDGKLCFSEKERGKVWKNYMERIMHEEMIGIMTWMEFSRRFSSLCEYRGGAMVIKLK